jgi:hypothetical protein
MLPLVRLVGARVIALVVFLAFGLALDLLSFWCLGRMLSWAVSQTAVML